MERHYSRLARGAAKDELYSAAASDTIRADTVKTVRLALVTAGVIKTAKPKR